MVGVSFGGSERPRSNLDIRRTTPRIARGERTPIGGIREPDLERQGRVLGASGWRFLVFGLIVALPGIALVVFSDGRARAIGIAVGALAGGPVVVGGALLLSSRVARWSARHKLFA